MANQRACANAPSLSRRNLLIGATAAPIAMMATSSGAGVTPTPSDLPAWWEKLTGASAEADPEVFRPWQDTVLSRELGRKLDELRELLLLMGTPVDVDTITDFRLHWSDGGVPQNVIAVGRSGVHGEGMHVFRPEFGWVDKSAKIGVA